MSIRPANRIAATSLLVLVVVMPCNATTVIVFATHAGTVVGADGLATTRSESLPDTHSTVSKLVLVQKRIAIAAVGLENASRGNLTAYDFPTWISRIQNALPENISVDDFVATIRRESAVAFTGFDVILTSGSLKQHDRFENCELLTQYVIAGYVGSDPHVSVVQFYIDWQRRTLIGPEVHNLQANVGGALIAQFGMHQALDDLLNPASYAYKRVMALCPETLPTLLLRSTPSTLGQIAGLVRAFIDVEGQTNPGSVGGPTAIVTITPSGDGTREIHREPSKENERKRAMPRRSPSRTAH